MSGHPTIAQMDRTQLVNPAFWASIIRSDNAALFLARVSALAAVFLLVYLGGEVAAGVHAIAMSSVGILAFFVSLGIATNYPHLLLARQWTSARVFTAGFIFLFVSSLLGICIWLVLAKYIWTYLFHRSVSYGLVLALGVALPMVLAETHIKPLLQAHNSLRLLSACSFVSIAFPAIAALVVYLTEGELDGVISGVLVGQFLSFLIHAFLALRFAGFCKTTWADMNLLGTLGIVGYLGGLASLANYRLDRLIIATFAGPALVGVYATLTQIAELGRMLPLVIQATFIPRAASMPDNEAWQQSGRLTRIVVLMTVSTMALILPLGILVSRFIGLPSSTWLELSILCIGIISVAGTTPIVAYNISAGRPFLNSSAAITGLVLTLSLSPVLIPRYALLGASITSAISYFGFGVVLLLGHAHGPLRENS